MLGQFCLANLRLSSYFRINKHLQHFIKLFHEILPSIRIGTQIFDLQGKIHSGIIWIPREKSDSKVSLAFYESEIPLFHELDQCSDVFIQKYGSFSFTGMLTIVFQ